MSLYKTPSQSSPTQQHAKMIFAPAGEKTNAQAEQYTKGTLSKSDLSDSPLTQFHQWFKAAQTNHVHQPETVCLSTASLPSGRVSSRVVYLKELDDRGFVVYSNWGTSNKSKDVASNKWASLTFWWREMERQVRVEGICERLSQEESFVYYRTRARGSKIGAWASRQSQVLENGERTQLEEWVKEVEERFQGESDIPVPEFWGGMRIRPVRVEFWQGRESRLHDRFVYDLVGEEDAVDKEEQEWTLNRLSP